MSYTSISNRTNKLTRIYPNLFSSSAIVQIPNGLNKAELSIYNSLGQYIKQIKNIKGQQASIDRNGMPNATCYLKVTDGKFKIDIIKIVVLNN